MKRMIFLALMLVYCLTSTGKISGDEPKSSSKQVIMREQGTLIEDRSRHFDIDVFIYDYCISIEGSEIGDAEVYIVDSFGGVVEYGILSSVPGTLVMDVPETPGCYTIVIWSDTYYGEGEFVIE